MRTGADEHLRGRIEIECQHCDALFRRARRGSLHLFAPLIQAFSRQLVTGLTVTFVLLAISLLLNQNPTALAAPDDVEQKEPEAPANAQFFQMDEAHFDANVFQPSGNAQQARVQLETKFKLQFEELNRVCELTDAQRQKLKLAASSDLKRFFDEVAVLRKKVSNGQLDQNAWNNIWQEIQPLRNKQAAGLFGETSFFAKTVRKTLTEEQFAKYDSVTSDRRRFRYRAAIEVALTSLESSVPLNHSQHETIVKLLMDETQPPPTFGQYDQYLVMYQLGHLPEEKLKSLLDEQQWKLLQVQINQNRGMEQFLIQNGLLPKEKGEVKILKAKVRRIVIQAAPAADAGEPANRTVEP